jgi:hypothetical protein
MIPPGVKHRIFPENSRDSGCDFLSFKNFFWQYWGLNEDSSGFETLPLEPSPLPFLPLVIFQTRS